MSPARPLRPRLLPGRVFPRGARAAPAAGAGGARGAPTGGSRGSFSGASDDGGPPPKPAAQVIYEKFFAPKVLPAGLDAIEADDSLAFHNLKTQLGNQAQAAKDSKSDGILASIIFTKTVDKQWTADVVNNVLKQLAVKRSAYNTAGFVVLSAHNSWERYPQ